MTDEELEGDIEVSEDDLVENDEISSEEAGFMAGYNEASEDPVEKEEDDETE